MTSPDPQDDSSVAPETADEDMVEWVDNGLRLRLAPFGLEELQEYVPGGYHPVHLGDVLGDAYRIIHKLGHGGFGTVWLARDLSAKETTKYVALKILVADASGDDCPELLMDRLAGQIGKVEGLGDLCFPLSRFKIEGPNGSHLCFVYPVLGPRVSYGVFRDSNDLEEILLRVCYGVTAAMALLHHLGICHGDFRPHNILHPVTGLDGLSEEEVLDILGKPRRNPVFNANGLSREEVLNILSGRSRTPVLDANEKENTTMHTGPRYLVYPVGWDDVDIAYILKTAKIIDFGECFDIAKPPENVGTPGCYRAPELLLERKVGIPSDLCALACTLFEIRTGRKLFEAFFDEDDDYLGDMCDVLGRLPEPWWSTTWEARRQFFKDETDEHGRVVSVHELKTSVHDDSKRDYVVISSGPPEARSLVDKIGHGMMYMEGSFYKDIADEEKPVFADLLGKLLAFTPENRISAQAALEHGWFRI